MDKRQIAITIIGLVGVLEAGDFVAAVRSIASSSMLGDAASALGISPEQAMAREAALVVLTLLICALCFASAWGFYRNLKLKSVYRWAAVALLANALFHFITVITLPASTLAEYIAVGYTLAAVIVFGVGWWASRSSN